ncbi:hypothetical protein L0Y59_01665 [Candidatus Uhrbacteria bacterium]|nr:hypothetical protein [Candidatus Uhrbacteria bacterium]
MKAYMSSILLTFVVGCTGSASVRPLGSETPASAECSKLSGEERVACLEFAYPRLIAEREERLAKEKETERGAAGPNGPMPSNPMSSAAFVPPPGIGFGRIVGTHNPREGCFPSHNYAVVNKTPHFLEVRGGDAMQTCGEDGGSLVLRAVRQGNSGVRPARLVPPGETGYFYFDPLLGGAGKQNIRILAYGASHVDGFSPEAPLIATGGMMSPNDIRMPADESAWGYTTYVRPEAVRPRRW